MLTTDVALTADAEYAAISKEYANDINSLESDFSTSWYRLMTNDMGPPERCIGDDVPPAQPWQHALPAFEGSLPDYIPIRTSIQEAIDANPDNVSTFARLAFYCASSFRETDYRGGCNGARIRFSPEKDWYSFSVDDALAQLEPIKSKHPEISYSDLIVLAGQTAVESAGAKPIDFCGGRVDAGTCEPVLQFVVRFLLVLHR